MQDRGVWGGGGVINKGAPQFKTTWEGRVHLLKPFTLRAPPESIVCYFHTFDNNLGIKQ